jgi:integrase
MLRRRRKAPDRSRALSRADVERLLTRDDTPIRERTLWRLLYETAARSAEVLRLDVEDLDLPNRKAKVRRKGGAIDGIVWQTSTARLLPRLLKGRKAGPAWSCRRATSTRRSAGPGCPTGRLRTYSRPRPAERTSTNCGTAR